MAGDSVVVKTRKFMKNPLLSRRQVRWNERLLHVPLTSSIIALSLHSNAALYLAYIVNFFHSSR